MPGDLRSKALGYLRDGAVEIRTLTEDARVEDNIIRTVMAMVQGHNGSYVVDGRMGLDVERRIIWERWSCTCRNYTFEACPHRAAVQLVTGSGTEIRPAPKEQKTRPSRVAQPGS